MPRVKITVDSKVLMDAALGEWSSDPPEILTEQLKASRPAPVMRSIMLTLADAAITDKNTIIEANNLENGWDLTVRYA